MAQWMRQFTGATHDTKVQDVEESLQSAVQALADAAGEARADKLKAVEQLAGRLLKARLKAVRAKISALSEPGMERKAAKQLPGLETSRQQLLDQGVDGILREFKIPKESYRAPTGG